MPDGGPHLQPNPLEHFSTPATPEVPAAHPEAAAEAHQTYLQKAQNPEFVAAMVARVNHALGEAAVEIPKSAPENKFSNESTEDLNNLLADLNNKIPAAKETMKKVFAQRAAEIQNELTARGGSVKKEVPQFSTLEEAMPESSLVQHLRDTAPVEAAGPNVNAEQDLARAKEQLQSHNERMQTDTTASATANEKMKAHMQEEVARKQKEAEALNAAIDAQKGAEKKVEGPVELSNEQLSESAAKVSAKLMELFKYKALMPDNLKTLQKLLDGARDDASKTKFMKSFVQEAEKVIAKKAESAAADTATDKILASSGKFTEQVAANDNKEIPDVRKAA